MADSTQTQPSESRPPPNPSTMPGTSAPLETSQDTQDLSAHVDTLLATFQDAGSTVTAQQTLNQGIQEFMAGNSAQAERSFITSIMVVILWLATSLIVLTLAGGVALPLYKLLMVKQDTLNTIICISVLFVVIAGISTIAAATSILALTDRRYRRNGTCVILCIWVVILRPLMAVEQNTIDRVVGTLGN